MGGAGVAGAALEGEEDAVARLMATRTALTPEQVALFHRLFRGIMTTHFGAVWDALRRWGAGETDADDLTQEVFASFLQRAPAEGIPESIPAKLVADAIGRLRNFRRDGRRETAGLPSSGSEKPGSAPDLARKLDHQEFRSRILLTLAPDQLALVDAVFLREQSQAQAAAELGIPRSTLAAKLHKLMPELHALAEAFFSESERG